MSSKLKDERFFKKKLKQKKGLKLQKLQAQLSWGANGQMELNIFLKKSYR